MTVNESDARAAAASEDLSRAEDYLRREEYLDDDQLRAQLLERVRAEKEAVDSWLHGGEFYIIAGSGKVHLPTCDSVGRWLDREQMWQPWLDDLERVRNWHGGDNAPAFPKLLDRAGVEALRTYTTCQLCAPTLDHIEKRGGRKGWQSIQASSLGAKHFGLHLSTTEGRELGQLVRISNILTADGQDFQAEFTASEPITDPDTLMMYQKKTPTGLPADPAPKPWRR